ncbi:WecB/TagA/CpsF family glycosyltransferase [Paraflavisolibacter sp. H34]|uniref:WecB/TagA/CpsF family glycosyltransferase n=1 Tax=Huijunlia imazamoxiresistens TaxID=3127457 RepID=UPI0030190CE9
MNTERLNILGLHISRISYAGALEQVAAWGRSHTPSYVCFANVHMTIEGHKDPEFARQVNGASLVVADGFPLAKACRLLYGQVQERIDGMGFLPRLIAFLNTGGYRIFLYGGSPKVLAALEQVIRRHYPRVEIAGAVSPPFRDLSSAEQEDYIRQINESGAHVVFVALGCPKQERWMHRHHGRIKAVLLGVGGAFSVMAGLQKRAPQWMQEAGLEWVFRLAQEPRRLFKRYFVTNLLFVWLLGKQLLKKKVYGK